MDNRKYNPRGWKLRKDGFANKTEARFKRSVMCECTRRVYVGEVNAKGWTVCDHCGKKILRPRDEFKRKLLEALRKYI